MCVKVRNPSLGAQEYVRRTVMDTAAVMISVIAILIAGGLSCWSAKDDSQSSASGEASAKGRRWRLDCHFFSRGTK
jgi:hypothetical protein